MDTNTNNTSIDMDTVKEELMETEVVDDVVESDESSSDELVNEDNVDTFKLLNMVAQLDDMKQLVKSVKDNVSATTTETKSEESADKIDEKARLLTKEEIEKMTDSQILGIFSDEDGAPYEFITLDNPKEDIEFKRDFLIMRSESLRAIDSIDAEIAKMEEAMKEYDEEIKEITSKYSNINQYLISNFTEKMEAAESDEEKEKYANMIAAMKDALELNRVKEFYSINVNRKNLIPNFILQKKTKVIYKKYQTMRKMFKSRTDLFNFGDIEKRYLPEKYHARNDLFVFSIINMVATWTQCTTKDNIVNGMFLSQFCVNLKNLVYDKFETEDDKNTFVTAMCDILDMVM